MAVKRTEQEVAPLVVSLAQPGMTPMLRAGVGGLAASLRSIARGQGVKWPTQGSCRVPLGPGAALVESNQVTIEWGSSVEKTLTALVKGSFNITKQGVIDLPGTRNTELSLPVQVAMQDALKRTFLQHGKTTTKKGALKTTSIEIDDHAIALTYQPYSSFVHMTDAVESITHALKRGAVDLAGWAYPGAAVRHTGLGNATSIEYPPSMAVAAFFGLVGCLSFQAPSRAGVLVLLIPNDLLAFARVRELLTPRSVARVTIAGPSDAVLTAQVALRSQEAGGEHGVAGTQALLLRATPWDSKQKYRVATVSSRGIPEKALRAFKEATGLLEVELIPLKDKKSGAAAGFFAAPSALREFVANNLASGHRWFESFATARPDGERFIHYFRQSDNKGALSGRERAGLEVMMQSLDEAEAILVRSVHIAIRQRFGAIADETPAAPARKKRWENERERWRLVFAQAKTHEQVRAGLADLWSRAGSNSELKANWEKVLPLLRNDSWQAARDLALVALASYRGATPDSPSTENIASLND